MSRRKIGTSNFAIAIIGGGPAGLAPLVAATISGSFPDLALKRVCVIERRSCLGEGRLGDYVINGDSSSVSFLAAVRESQEPSIAALAMEPEAQAVAAYGDEPVPLTLVARFERRLGEALGALITSAGGAVQLSHEAIGAHRLPSGQWRVEVRSESGNSSHIVADNIIIAAGASQPEQRLYEETVAGRRLYPGFAKVLVQSDWALTREGYHNVARHISGINRPRVAIIGGSTSAISCAKMLLLTDDKNAIDPGAITVLHRHRLNLFYKSQEACKTDNYTSFNSDDICPISGFVHRFGGLRMDARELVMQARGLSGRKLEPRIELHHIDPDDPDASWHIIEAADIVIAALGYCPIGIPIYDVENKRICLRSELGANYPLVDKFCRVVNVRHQVVPGVFSIGLAAGFHPTGLLGGEPSFRGQVNGLWLWQHEVGQLIIDQLLSPLNVPSRADFV